MAWKVVEVDVAVEPTVAWKVAEVAEVAEVERNSYDRFQLVS